jgi:hypothetical protein
MAAVGVVRPGMLVLVGWLTLLSAGGRPSQDPDQSQVVLRLMTCRSPLSAGQAGEATGGETTLFAARGTRVAVGVVRAATPGAVAGGPHGL